MRIRGVINISREKIYSEPGIEPSHENPLYKVTLILHLKSTLVLMSSADEMDSLTNTQ